MTPDQKYDLLRLLIQVGLPIVGVLVAGFGGAIVGAFLTAYLRYRESIDRYRIGFVNTLQGAIRDSDLNIVEFVKLDRKAKSLKEPIVRQSLSNLKQKVSWYINNGFSIEMMIGRKGNQLLYGSVLALHVEMRNYDDLLTDAELTDEGLEGIRTLLKKITKKYKNADYDPDNLYTYTSRHIKGSLCRRKGR